MQVEQYWFPKDVNDKLQVEGRDKTGFVDGYHIDIVLRDSFLTDFVNEKKETLYQVADNAYSDILIEVSDELETAEGQRIGNLVSFIEKIGELNSVRVR